MQNPTSKVSIFTPFFSNITQSIERLASALNIKGQSLFLSLFFFAAPLFIIQWQFDYFQLMADQLALPDSSLDLWKWQSIVDLGSKLRTSLESLADHTLNAVFSPACIAHEVITNKDGLDWTKVAIDGTSLPSALNCWASGLPDADHGAGGAVYGASGAVGINANLNSGKIIHGNSNEVAALDDNSPRQR